MEKNAAIKDNDKDLEDAVLVEEFDMKLVFKIIRLL